MKFVLNFILYFVIILLNSFLSYRLSQKEINTLSADTPLFLQKNSNKLNNNLKKHDESGEHKNLNKASSKPIALTSSGAPCERSLFINKKSNFSSIVSRTPPPSILSPPSIEKPIVHCPCSSNLQSSSKVTPCVKLPSSSPVQKEGCPPPQGINPYDVIIGKETPKAIDSDGTDACITDNKSTNALGYIGPLSYAITRPPYKIQTCDQVLIMEGETFSNPSDYTKRQKVWFTLSVYMINLFTFDKTDKKDPDNLKNHMLLQNITSYPSDIYGAIGCIEFFEAKNMNRIVICLKDESTAEKIKEAYVDYMQCRLGNNLKELDMNKINEILKTACLGRDISFSDTSKIYSFMNSLKKKPIDNNERSQQYENTYVDTNSKYYINPAYDIKVPGSK